MDKGEERGGAPIVGEPRDGLRFGCRREPRKCRDLAGRQAVDLRKVISNLANLGQTDERAADLAATLDVWAIAQAVESTLAITLGYNDKAVQALALRRRHPFD